MTNMADSAVCANFQKSQRFLILLKIPITQKTICAKNSEMWPAYSPFDVDSNTYTIVPHLYISSPTFYH